MALTAKKVYAILKRQISDMEAKLNSPVRYRGTVATADLLPLNPDIGDMYNIESKSVYGEAGMNVAWNGVVWDTMGAPIDMSLYIKSSELADWVKQQNKPTYTANEVGALPADTKIPSKTSELKNDSGFLTKVPDGYLNGTDKTLSVSGKAADAKTTGDKFTEMSADISKKLGKNQGSENSGKIAGINESGDIVPMFPVGVEYNEETNCLEFGSDQKMELNQGIGLDSTLTKTGFAADAGVTGKEINSLKESISTKITKFYASNQGETHLADSDNGKIMDMMVYGKSEQKQYSGKNLLDYTSLNGLDWFGLRITKNDEGFLVINGTVTPNENDEIAVIWLDADGMNFTGTYKVLGVPNIDGCSIGGKSIGEAKYAGRIFEWNNSHVTVALQFKKGTILKNAVFKPTITKDTALTYETTEPYTGGIPSPNPDYPQEIKSVVNPTAKVCGKNLFDSKKFPIILNRAIDTNTGDTYESSSGRYCATEKYIPFPHGGKKVSFNASMSLCAYDKDYKFISAVRYNSQAPFGTMYVRFDIRTEDKDKAQIELSENTTTYEPYHEQTVTLPYTLNAIPVSAGGNVTIDGQQYVSDYFDVERGKLVRMCKEVNALDYEWTDRYEKYVSIDYGILPDCVHYDKIVFAKSTHDYYTSYQSKWDDKNTVIFLNSNENSGVRIAYNLQIQSNYSNLAEFKEWLKSQADNGTPLKIVYALATPEEIDLTPEEVQAIKALATYYPVTNISVNSEELDGYTVFNYPISMKNGWDYVKKQLNDNRDYIYDMDLQSAEAYVNSEYAVALTELEV